HGDVVGLRGLVLDGKGTALGGIDAQAVGSLHIQNCVIRNFEGVGGPFGVLMSVTSGTGAIFLSDTLIYNNGAGAGSGGVFLRSDGGSINGVLDRVRLENNLVGLGVLSGFATGGARVTVRDTTVVGNAGDGILAGTNGTSSALVFVERTTAVNN